MLAPDTLPLEAAPFLDIANPDYSIRSPEVRAARDASWYARTPYGLAILRYDEMGKLLVHPSLRQGSHAWPELNGVNHGLFAEWWGSTILVTEGADHTRLRRFVNPAFTPFAVKSMMPFFETLTQELLAKFIDRGSCDFMADFADPYAGRVLTMLLGLDDDKADEILQLAGDMGIALGVTYKQELDVIEAATKQMYLMVEEIIAERKANPGEDLMSVLIQKEVDGERLNDDELMNLGVMLVFAGVDTTRNQLGLGMTLFLQNPQQWEHLAQDPSLDMNAALECMRLRHTITWVSREAIEDFEFQGLHIKKGTALHLFSESAGTDARAYEDAPFDITEKRTRNFGFGGGMHVCLGQIVAKNDMAVAYRLLSQQLTDIRMNGTPEYLPDSGNTGPIKLPIAFRRR
jgi:cytochrome P450